MKMTVAVNITAENITSYQGHSSNAVLEESLETASSPEEASEVLFILHALCQRHNDDPIYMQKGAPERGKAKVLLA